MKNKRAFCIILFFLSVYPSYCQDLQLENYVRTGLESNLALLQKQDDFAMSLRALKSAAGYFFPDISLNARYTVARGGRVIEFPVGDMLNPVYNTLNLLTQSEQFPNVENQEFPFYRPQEQETKLSLVQPVFNAQIIYNYQVEKGKMISEKIGVDIYKRELVNEIKKAYYNYQKAVQLKKLMDETLVLLTENVRVSKSLFNNGMVTSDVIFRSEAELQKIKASLAEAEKMVSVSKAYLNFLINRPLETEIESALNEISSGELPVLSSDEQIHSALNTREELLQINNYQSVGDKYIKLARSSNYPNVYFAVNYGIQGEKYSFTSDDDFMLASLVLQWNLFQGLKNNANVQQAKIASHQLELKRQEVERQIEMQIIDASYDLMAASESLAASEKQSEAAEKAYKVVEHRYSNGQAALIEFIDARTAMTTSKQSLIIIYFDYKIKQAGYERVTATSAIYY